MIAHDDIQAFLDVSTGAADAAVSPAAFGKSCGLLLWVFPQLRREARHNEGAREMPTGPTGTSSIAMSLPIGADHRFAPSKTGQDR